MSRKISASKQRLFEVWTKIEERLEQRRLPAISSRSFVDYAWDNFDVKEVTSILSSAQDSFFGHKEILFAGLCAWVACPSKLVLVKHAIALTAAEHLEGGETVQGICVETSLSLETFTCECITSATNFLKRFITRLEASDGF